MKKIETFQCEICSKTYQDENVALGCEMKGIQERKYHRGQKLRDEHAQYVVGEVYTEGHYNFYRIYEIKEYGGKFLLDDYDDTEIDSCFEFQRV